MKIKTIHRAITLLGLVFGLMPFGLRAQSKNTDSVISRFYVKASTGYGISINGDFVNNTDDNNNVTNTPTKLGNGIYSNIGAGYQYNSNLGAEFSIGYLAGIKSNAFPSYDGNSDQLNGTMWHITPSIVFSTNIGKLRPYLRTGLIIGLPEVYIDEAETNNNGSYPADVTETKVKYYNGLAAGIQTSLGCSYPISNKMSIFAEAIFNNISYLPDNGEEYYYNVGGVNQLPSLSVSDKEMVFKKSGSLFNIYGPANQPTVYAQQKIPFSGIYLNIGIKMDLGNQTAPMTLIPEPGQRFYARVNLGYGFATNGDLFYNITETQDTGYYSTSLYSAGQGFNAGIGGGYMLTKNIGFDLGLNYVASAKYKVPGTGFYDPYVDPNEFYYESTQYGNMFQINPSVFLTTNIGQFKPYTRLGIIIGFGTVYTGYNINLNDSAAGFGNYSLQSTIKYYGGISIGYSTVLGVAYPINKMLDVYTEASFNSIYFVPTNSVVTSEVLDGTDNLGNLNTSEKNAVYKASYNSNSTNTDPDKPSVASPVRFSFSAVVASMGIRIWLK